MANPKKTYNRRAIYELLLVAFTLLELRRFCRFRDGFVPLQARIDALAAEVAAGEEVRGRLLVAVLNGG